MVVPKHLPPDLERLQEQRLGLVQVPQQAMDLTERIQSITV